MSYLTFWFHRCQLWNV